MRGSQFVLGILIIILGLTPYHANAASLRCGTRLITIGDYTDYVQIWEEERVYGYRHHPQYYGIYDNYDFSPTTTEHEKPYRVKKLVIVEEWTYNHGPTRFLDHLLLENGIVRSIVSGDYGY